MDNLEQLNSIISEQVAHHVEHELGHLIGSPMVINRAVGEAMRHIGGVLNLSAAQYLPVRPEEIMVPPEPLSADSRDAVVLVRRSIPNEPAFKVLGFVSTKEGNRQIELQAYTEDPYDLVATKFLSLSKPIGQELVRQLGIIVNGDGAVLLQAIVLKNYFPPAPVQVEDATADASTAAAPASGLPPVDVSGLL